MSSPALSFFRDPGTWLLGGLAALALFQPLACDSEPPGEDPLAAAASGMLADVGPEVIRPTVAEVQLAAVDLQEAIADWEDALAGSGDVDDRLALAQGAWQQTLLAWQEA